MTEALQILALVVAVAVVAAGARRLGLSAPLVLVVVGLACLADPRDAGLRPRPRGGLFGFLPPLLYAAAPHLAGRRPGQPSGNGRARRRSVLFTTAVVGVVAWVVVPRSHSPPDRPRSDRLTSGRGRGDDHGRRVGMPRRLVSILEGESLLNDATALVSLRTAIAAITMVSVRPDGRGDFGRRRRRPVVGWASAIAALLAARERLTDPVLDTTLSFVAPFLAYLPAEEIHASGVLAVVVTDCCSATSRRSCSRRPPGSRTEELETVPVRPGERRLPAYRPAGP